MLPRICNAAWRRYIHLHYVTGHLPREHPHVVDTTHDDRAEEGVFLGNDLTTPTFWLWSFKHRKAMRLSDPKHFDHILPFLQPADVYHSIPLSSADIVRMHAHDDAGELGAGKDVGDVDEQVELQGQRRRRALADSGEQTPAV